MAEKNKQPKIAKKMKQTIKISLVLSLVCLTCAFLLGLVYTAAKEKIAENQRQLIQDSIKQLLPTATDCRKISTDPIPAWKLYHDDNPAGYAFIASGQGYGGPIKIMAAVDFELKKIIGIRVIQDSETPGLGSRIREDDFGKQFKSLNLNRLNQVKTITGATISSKSVIKALIKTAAELKEEINEP